MPGRGGGWLAYKVREAIRQYPDASNIQIARLMGCSRNFVCQQRKRLGVEVVSHPYKIGWVRQAALALCILCGLASEGRPHDMYREWRAPMGTNCCHNKDCGVWNAEDVEPLANGSFYVRSIGQTVTKDRVLPSPDGKVHMCCVREGDAVGTGPCQKWKNGTYTVRCIAVPMGY
jgi:hypothetical protein